MSRRTALLLLPLLVAVCMPRAVHCQTIIAGIQLDRFTISPNGDGVTDSTVITYTLIDTATVHLLILAKDSVTVVDTLVGGISQLPAATPVSVPWDGTSSAGTVVTEDRYLVFLKAREGTMVDSVFLNISVDLTLPVVMITNVSPSTPFAPGVPGQPTLLKIDYLVTDPPPSDSVFVSATLFDPAGSIVQTLANSDQPVNSPLRVQWDGSGATDDGFYQVRITATDEAGQTASASTDVNVDTADPTVTITSLQPNENFQSLPDSLFGWVWDRNGIDSVFVRYSGGTEAFRPITSTRLVVDTVFFAVQLVDSLSADGSYTLGFKAVDVVGHERVLPFAISLDSSAPTAPVLNPPQSPTTIPNFLLTATVSADTEIMRIFRNTVLVDTIFPNLPGAAAELPRVVALLPGTNRITAIAVDRALNASPLSNEIVVVFDNAAGLSIPQPFLANNIFQINLTRPALVVTLKIYDLGGHLVEELSNSVLSTNVSITWDGLNGDDAVVEKGPLVAVVRVNYQDGGKEIFREIFLFQP